MTRLLLVRHGETIWNHTSRYQGHTDIELSETGREQARSLAKRLKTEKVKAVYSSDLKRAFETASILASPHNLPVKATKELREINFGDWEGLTYQEIMEEYRELASEWYQHPGKIRIPGGETFTDVKERAYNTILELARQNDPGTIIVVAHGGTIRAIICGLLDIDLNHAFQIRQDNTALNIIEYNHGGYIVLSLLNGVSHLG
ncbi:MAG: alpha-ribazole phosphatase [Syntrophaceticus schinkii]|nr:alpha-ribazole phosphatase [Syntrophaceticus schinkii]MDD4261761.1 alpha-ribazole phosphatase [Syntrophaceticus schinkii]